MRFSFALFAYQRVMNLSHSNNKKLKIAVTSSHIWLFCELKINNI